MKFAIMIAFTALTVQAASTAGDAPLKLDREAFSKASFTVDNGFRILWPDYPLELVGVTQTVYIKGYGAVLAGEVNLAPGLNINPFHPTITKDDIARTRIKKVERMPGFRTAMQDLLVKSAVELHGVPDNEEVALAISLFYWHWEDRGGLPDQIVMHGTRKALVDAAHDKAALASVVRIDEF